MKKFWPLLALGIGAFLVLALVTLPASAVLSFFHPPDITLTGVSGTVWKGRAQAVRSGTVHLGSVDWDLDILSLFTGKLGANVKVTRTDGFAQGHHCRCTQPTHVAWIQRIAAGAARCRRMSCAAAGPAR